MPEEERARKPNKRRGGVGPSALANPEDYWPEFPTRADFLLTPRRMAAKLLDEIFIFEINKHLHQSDVVVQVDDVTWYATERRDTPLDIIHKDSEFMKNFRAFIDVTERQQQKMLANLYKRCASPQDASKSCSRGYKTQAVPQGR